jgi:integrase
MVGLVSKLLSLDELFKGPLFRAALRKTKTLAPRPLSLTAKDAGIPTAIGCHTFRATGLTDYLSNGSRIELAQRMAGHSNAKTTKRPASLTVAVMNVSLAESRQDRHLMDRIAWPNLHR